MHVLVSGRVQGVGFRWAARVQALRLQVSGWIRNNYDGDVEVHAEGPGEAVAQFVAWLEKGPPYAQVDSIEVLPTEARDFVTFEIED